MAIASGALRVTTEAEPPFLEQDGNKLSRNIVRKEFSGDMVGTSEAQMVAVYTGTPDRLATSPLSTSPGRSKESRDPWSFSTAGSWPKAKPSSS